MNSKSRGETLREELESQEAAKEHGKYFVYHGAVCRVQNLKDHRELNAEELEAKLRKEEKKTAPPVKLLGDDIASDHKDKEAANSDAPIPNHSETPTSTIVAIPPANREKALTQIQYATSHKQILVPTMSTLSIVFRQHLIILRGLKDKVADL